jgi:hypothetical protein
MLYGTSQIVRLKCEYSCKYSRPHAGGGLADATRGKKLKKEEKTEDHLKEKDEEEK